MASGEEEQRQRIEQGLLRALLVHELRDLLAHLRINCVIDVGAHRGESGRLLRGIGFAGRIVSFEPAADSYAALAEAAGEDEHWLTERLALGDRSGEARLQDTGGSELRSLLAPTPTALQRFPALAPREPGSAPIVPVATLDQLFDRCVSGLAEPRVLLKIDTQGSELAVLHGAVASLERIAAVQVEAALQPLYSGAPGYIELLAHLAERGFELAGLQPGNRDRDRLVIDLDCLLVRDPR
jgi:FkbM family methyltransferase